MRYKLKNEVKTLNYIEMLHHLIALGYIKTWAEYLDSYTKEELIQQILDETWFDKDYRDYCEKTFNNLIYNEVIRCI